MPNLIATSDGGARAVLEVAGFGKVCGLLKTATAGIERNCAFYCGAQPPEREECRTWALRQDIKTALDGRGREFESTAVGTRVGGAVVPGRNVRRAGA